MASKMYFFCVAVFALISVPLSHVVLAGHHGGTKYLNSSDRDHNRHRERHRHRSNDYAGHYLNRASDPTYKENCGACHFPYQPGLLPSESWRKILSQIDDHFAESLDLEPEAKTNIANYLEANCADRSTAKLSAKIMRSSGNQAPMRITDIPYIRQKHRKIPSDILKRQAIGSLSNCTACHTRAEEGIYDDDDVVIPK